MLNFEIEMLTIIIFSVVNNNAQGQTLDEYHLYCQKRLMGAMMTDWVMIMSSVLNPKSAEGMKKVVRNGCFAT